MKVAFAFVRSRLCWGIMTGDDWLVWLGALNTLGEVLLGELVVFVILCYLGDTSTEAFHFGLVMCIGQRFSSGGSP
ncbi:unnamed protein product [Prunus armeniaca]